MGDKTDSSLPSSAAGEVSSSNRRKYIKGGTPEKIDYPTDRINNGVWTKLDNAEKDSGEKIRFGINNTKKTDGAFILYGINFDELEKQGNITISRNLTPFDKRVYIAVSAIYNQTGNIMSAGQIYAAMGNDGKPAASHIQKIQNSLTKMGAARIYMKSSEEVGEDMEAMNIVYKGPLLPFEQISVYINGGLSDSAIHVFREPPLMSFAKERHQVTTISRRLLSGPLNQSESNLTLEDYLIGRIATMKRNSIKRKLLYTEIYESCGIETKKQRERALDKITRLLTYYRTCGWIRGYRSEKNGIVILL